MSTMTSENILPRLKGVTVEKIALGKIFYLSEGRNAWWSIWAITYWTDDFVHTTLIKAKDNAERKRKQGSVFYITELPILLVQGGDLVLGITQINCSNVLAGYSATAIPDSTRVFREKVDDLRDNYLNAGSPLRGVYLSFQPGSRFWHDDPPFEDSVIRLLHRGVISDFEPLGENPLVRYKSRSAGAAYNLDWEKTDRTNVSSVALKKLLQSTKNGPLQ